MEKYEVVIVGGGHNGLTVAGYLAKAGLNVCVLEAKKYVGGGVITREITLPGFKHDIFSTVHIFLAANPLIRHDELQLRSKYGLKYIFPDPLSAVIYPDDNSMIFHKDLDKTCASIEKISKRDAEAYSRYSEWASPNLDLLTMGMFSPPAPFSSMVSILEKSEQGRELLGTMLKSAMDIADENFESDMVKVAFTRFASEAMIDPRTGGSGTNVLLMVAMAHKYGFPFPEGGSEKLTEALERCIKDLGGTIKTSSPVKNVKVEKGEAKGVILESGEEIIATKAVVSTVNVKQVFLKMLEAEQLPADFSTKVRRLKHASYSTLLQQLALNNAPKYKAGEEVDRTWFVMYTPFMEDYLKGFDAYQYGYTVTNMPLVVCSTLLDPTRAPEGKHTLYLYHFQTYRLKEGGSRWDQIKYEVADGILQTLRDHTINMGDENILGRHIETPLDLERGNLAWIEGDYTHIGGFLFQAFSNRPFIGWGSYKTPIEKLYMAGASTHPGGGVMGGGRAAVQVIMDDLGLDFKKLVG